MSRVGGRYKPRRAKNICVCEWCHQTFQATRYDAKTCSKKCRKALSRHTSDRDHQNSVTRTKRAVVIKSRSQVVGQIELPDEQPQERFFYRVKN